MSNQSFPEKSNNPSFNSGPLNRMPNGIGSPTQLAQFTAAAANNYQPQAYSKAPAHTPNSGFNLNDPAQQAKALASMSPFAASAYEAALKEAGIMNAGFPEIKLLPPPASQPVDSTFKGLKFVTLDGLQIETREVYDDLSGTFQWEMCESQEDRCITYIREKCADKRVFLIASGSLGKKVVPEIHNLSQVYAIYIYCSDVKYHLEWAKDHPKVRVVCNNDDLDLLPQFAVDVAQANVDWGDALLKENKRDLAKEKYQKAYNNLTRKLAKKPDPAMVSQVKTKLESC